MMLHVRATQTTPDVERGADLVVEDGPDIRALIERGRFELLREIDYNLKPEPKTRPVKDSPQA